MNRPKCRKFTGEYEGFNTKISKFIVQKTSSIVHIEKHELFLKNTGSKIYSFMLE